MRPRARSLTVLASIVIRVEDLPRQIEFWSAALDYVPREDDDDDFTLLRPRSGHGPRVSLDHRHADLHKFRRALHLDLYARDQAAEVERLKALGATEVDWPRKPAEADFVILADPEGNRFCVIDAPDRVPED